MSRYLREKPRLALYTRHLGSLGWRIESAAESTGDDARVEIVAVQGRRRMRISDKFVGERSGQGWEMEVALLGPGGRVVAEQCGATRPSTASVLAAIEEADEWAGGGG